MLQRYLLLWLVLLSLLAFLWPEMWSRLIPAASGSAASRFDPFVVDETLKPLIITTMFAIGCLLPPPEVREVFRRWPTVLGGTTIQYTAMPLFAYAVGHAFRLDPVTMIGVTMVGCVPGAMASNVLTLAARGNVSYSVSLTTSATMLSPLVVPVALWLTLGAIEGPDPRRVFVELLTTVAGPVVAGYLLCRKFAALERVMRRIGPAVANLTILWIIAVVVGLNRDRLGGATATVLAPVLTINLLGYAAGYSGALAMRLPQGMRRALSLEVGMQNAGVGTFLVREFFPETPEAAIPTAAYTFGCMLTGTVLAQIWSMRVAAEASVAAESE